jgi:c-di-GMP-binding flagellar brake protein YcgR
MLDLKKYFTIGERIQIGFIDASGHLHDYNSQVVEIYNNEFIDILIPMRKNHDVYLKEDIVLKLIVSKGDAVYEFKAALHEKLFGRIPLLKLRILSEVNKIQRRNFYRLRLMKELEAKQVEDIKERKYGDKFKGNLLDISAGGLLFNSNKELQEKDMLELTLNLNSKKLIVFGIIVRKTFTTNLIVPYTYGVQFNRISDFERNEITKYIFEEQRRLIKKGLV